MTDERKEDCWDCGGSGTFCPSMGDRCKGCEQCPRCDGTGAEPEPHKAHELDGTVADPRRRRV